MTTHDTEVENDSLIVSQQEEGMRIDKFLANRFEEKSRTYFQFLLESGHITLNGSKIKKRTIVKNKDEIDIYFVALPCCDLCPEKIPLDILFEDDYLLAINKPQGMVVHPAPGNWSSTFVNALLYHCSTLSLNTDSIRPGIVHRLDKDTSGILLAAKTLAAQENLISQFQNRTIHKEYLAICVGNVPNKTVSASLSRHPIKRKEITICKDPTTGKEAISQFQLLAYNGKLSFILAQPFTGRTHQLRVHLKYLSTPILGDPLYGNAKINREYGLESQLLHAYRLQFLHPVTSQKMQLIAPLPENFKKILNDFSNHDLLLD